MRPVLFRSGTWLRRGFRLFGLCSILLLLPAFGYGLYLRIGAPVTTFHIVKRAYSPSKIHPSSRPKIQTQWVSLSKVKASLPAYIMAAEDSRFLVHSGVDWEAIWFSFQHNFNHATTKGGSTISQQLAKNLFLWQGRTYVRKLLELPLTYVLEICLSKERLMEIYINIVEQGDGVFGMQASANYYYHKPIHQLTTLQQASLVAILPSPIKWNPKSRKGAVYARIQRLHRSRGVPYLLQQIRSWETMH